MLFSIIHLNLSYKLCFLILCSLETWSCKLAYRSSVLLFLHFLLRRCMLFLSRSFCLLIRLLRHCVFCSLFLILFLVELLFHLVLWRSLILLVFCCWSNINWIRLLIVLVLLHFRRGLRCWLIFLYLVLLFLPDLNIDWSGFLRLRRIVWINFGFRSEEHTSESSHPK